MNTQVKNLRFLGGLGNQLFQYAYARAICARDGSTLHVEPWLGQQCFSLTDPSIDNEASSDFTGYHQTQAVISLYTRRDVLAWFPWQPAILEFFRTRPFNDEAAAHIRRGDYLNTHQVLVRFSSYECARRQYAPRSMLAFVGAEHPTIYPNLPAWLPDFYRLCSAPILFRANSTFSWWAAVLGHHADVYSPVIDGLPPGLQDCPFVPGNYPRCANTSDVTDLHLAP